jgi:hypothetical protein
VSFFAALIKANEYGSKAALDPTGEKAVEIMRAAQTFPEEHRMQIMRTLYESANAVRPDKWSASDVKAFKDKFAGICELNTDSQWFGSDADPIAFADLQERVMSLAKARGLSLSETIKELNEDPFYKEIMLKVNREKAMKFINQK